MCIRDRRNEAGERVSSRMAGIGLARFRQLADGDEIDTNTIRVQQWEKEMCIRDRGNNAERQLCASTVLLR